MMAFGDKAFGSKSGLEKIMRVGPHDGISTMLRRDTKELASSLCYVRTQ